MAFFRSFGVGLVLAGAFNLVVGSSGAALICFFAAVVCLGIVRIVQGSSS